MQANSDEQLRALLAFGTATIHEAQGQVGALDHAIKPLDPAMRLVGRAVTVDCRPDDNLAIHAALAEAQPGEVLVVAAKGFVEAGHWGDLMSLSAQKRGVCGLVIDGSVRDAQTIIDMGFPVFCRGVSIKGAAKNQGGRVGVPIVVAGVSVRPGDLIVGDRDGVVVVRHEELEAVIRSSRERIAKEDKMREAIEQGATIVQILGLEKKLQASGMR
jgi:4-hydroxy-4-methyl-2-oxoglutarate aldolase